MAPDTPEAPTTNTRTRVLQAAGELFWEQGFVGTSLAQIARRAGFTTGAIYVHFESKEVLFLALMEALGDDWDFLVAGDPTDVPADGTPGTGLRRIAAIFHDHLVDGDPRALAVRHELYAYALRNEAAGDALAAHSHRNIDRFAELIETGLTADGYRLTVAPEQLVMLIDILVEGLWLRSQVTDGPVDRDLWLTAVGLLEHLIVPAESE